MSRFFKDREKVSISEDVSRNKRRIARIQSIDQKTRKGFIPDTLEKMDNLFAEVDILFMFPQVNLAFANANVALNVLNTEEQRVANKIAAHQISTRNFNINNLDKRKGSGNLSPSERKTYETGRFRINRFLILLLLGILLLGACQNTVGTPLVDNQPTATQVSAVEPTTKVEPTPFAAPEAITVEAVTSGGGGGVTPPKQEAIGTRIPNEIIINAARVINVTLTPEDLDKFANVDQTSRKVMYRMASSDAGDNNVQIVMETTVNGAKFFLIPVEDVVSVQASNNGVSIVDGNGNVIGDIDFITQVYKPTPVPEAAPEAPVQEESQQDPLTNVINMIGFQSDEDVMFEIGNTHFFTIDKKDDNRRFDPDNTGLDINDERRIELGMKQYMVNLSNDGLIVGIHLNEISNYNIKVDEDGNPKILDRNPESTNDNRYVIAHILPKIPEGLKLALDENGDYIVIDAITGEIAILENPNDYLLVKEAISVYSATPPVDHDLRDFEFMSFPGGSRVKVVLDSQGQLIAFDFNGQATAIKNTGPATLPIWWTALIGIPGADPENLWRALETNSTVSYYISEGVDEQGNPIVRFSPDSLGMLVQTLTGFEDPNKDWRDADELVAFLFQPKWIPKK